MKIHTISSFHTTIRPVPIPHWNSECCVLSLFKTHLVDDKSWNDYFLDHEKPRSSQRKCWEHLPCHHDNVTHQGISSSQPCYGEKCMESVRGNYQTHEDKWHGVGLESVYDTWHLPHDPCNWLHWFQYNYSPHKSIKCSICNDWLREPRDHVVQASFFKPKDSFMYSDFVFDTESQTVIIRIFIGLKN